MCSYGILELGAAQYAVLLCGAVVWCDRGIPVPVRDRGQAGGSVMTFISSSGRVVIRLSFPVCRLSCYCSSPTSQHAVSMRVCCFLHLQSNEMTLARAYARRRLGYQMGRNELRRGPNPIYIILPLPTINDINPHIT